MPLFVNDTTDGKTFNTVYSSSLEALQFHGEIAWTQGEDFSWTTGLTWNQYSKIKDQTRAYGLMPFELNSNVRLRVIKDLYFKGDLFVFDGANYLAHASPGHFVATKGQGAFDLNAGMEFKITKALNLWFQMNNLLNSKYARWNQYQVYGFNFLGGIVFSFNQK